MSMFVRRAAVRAIPRTRGMANTTAELMKTNYHEKQAALSAHAAETSELWRRISIYGCLPGIVVAALWVRNVENEHAEHQHHIMEENGGHLPEIPAYEYMNKRAKPFPWGKNSLFFNPHVQKDLGAEE
ncbi:Cytochrome c oxidase subunit 6A, mitochondrial [Steccherinum ochraceum]|uniref:Cytochrome c oxidase subunit 6A, mitochondrial n=1 Tax=Steccherinum ochraceum TaxID=92696 RepID=A0A4R0RFA8_9APHY|nr:Cytochrome c oxidase subunit 6A, mitochondrial [Steccherinum ochraceum]